MIALMSIARRRDCQASDGELPPRLYWPMPERRLQNQADSRVGDLLHENRPPAKLPWLANGQRVLFGLLIIAIASVPAYIRAQVTSEDYARAEQFLPWNVKKLIANDHVAPQWIGQTSLFHYSRDLPDGGKEFIVVDARTGTREPAFDHARLAASLSLASKASYGAKELPFNSIDLKEDRTAIQFNIGENRWTCDLASYACQKSGKIKEQLPTEVISPNKRWAALLRAHNLFIREAASGREIPLTTDGKPDYDYASQPGSYGFAVSSHLLGSNYPALSPYIAPGVIWSPDSKRLITYKLDQRKVKEMYLIQSAPADGGVRPILYPYRYALPGDKDVATLEMMVFNVQERTRVKLNFPLQPVTYVSPFTFKFVWWGKESREVYFLQTDRWWKTFRLTVADAQTGSSRTILEEHGKTYIEPNSAPDEPNVRVLGNGSEIIWFSERSGWGHLYIYDGRTGVLKIPITSGPWLVYKISFVDEQHRWLYFTASGREENEDPYLQHLYRVKLDGSNLELLTPENANHEVSFSPDGRYFVDNYSRADLPSVAVLRSADGTLIRELEHVDASELVSKNWTPPEPFAVKAADGVTGIYGLIYRPSNFDPGKKYPVLDSIYPGPQMIRTPKTFVAAAADTLGQAQAIAELGFIVVTVDGRGTPGRSKAFHDYSYGNLGDAGGLEDHVAAIRQLAQRYSYMDLDRVGVYGHSGGGFAAVRALLSYPTLYKVAVASSGNQDQRDYIALWGEKYQGPVEGTNYLDAANSTVAGSLKGKLLLAWGEMDDNVPPSVELQLVNALIKANKDFDLLVLPNRNHTLVNDPYFVRRRWDYFVQHLIGVIPPEYEVHTSPPGYRTLDSPKM